MFPDLTEGCMFEDISPYFCCYCKSITKIPWNTVCDSGKALEK